MNKEECLYPRFAYSFNHETEDHFCGKKQGEEPPCRILYDVYTHYKSKLKVGDIHRQGDFSSPPACGHFAFRITRIDDSGIYGILVENTVRILDPEECY